MSLASSAEPLLVRRLWTGLRRSGRQDGGAALSREQQDAYMTADIVCASGKRPEQRPQFVALLIRRHYFFGGQNFTPDLNHQSTHVEAITPLVRMRLHPSSSQHRAFDLDQLCDLQRWPFCSERLSIRGSLSSRTTTMAHVYFSDFCFAIQLPGRSLNLPHPAETTVLTLIC